MKGGDALKRLVKSAAEHESYVVATSIGAVMSQDCFNKLDVQGSQDHHGIILIIRHIPVLGNG